uniref:Uncharacterized protein n=1 Tax=Loa loa TaxID=7209 RepID=A0A1I7VB34_LOALO
MLYDDTVVIVEVETKKVIAVVVIGEESVSLSKVLEAKDAVVGEAAKWKTVLQQLLKNLLLLCKNVVKEVVVVEEVDVKKVVVVRKIVGEKGGTAEVDVEMFIVEKEDVVVGIVGSGVEKVVVLLKKKVLLLKRKALLNLFIEEKGVVEFILKKSIAGGTAEVDVEMFIVEKEDVVVGIVGSGVEKVKALIGRKSHIKSK